MRGHRHVRQKLNARLAKANREGRLEEEFNAIEREGMRHYRQIMGTVAAPSKRGRKTVKRHPATA